jgi:2-dehydro-3-deoxyphosphogluconate aldolase / (4S)-4-hydroxy-2-oxoglutarate aldolase
MTETLRQMLRLAPVVPVITIRDLATAVPLARALVAGGLPVLEVTLRSDVALAAVRAIRDAAIPGAVLGVGTLTRSEQFASAAAAGASFGVSPGLTRELIAAAATVPFPLLPGVMTPSELILAREAGFSTLKLFPALQAGGIGMLKALHAVFPDVAFCPTGGITRETAPSFLQLPNVLCVGGSWVVPDDAVQAGDWGRIEALARDAAGLAAR